MRKVDPKEILRIHETLTKTIALVQKIIGGLFAAAGLWFFIDSTLELTGSDSHGFALIVGFLSAVLAAGFLIAGFTLRADSKLSWLGQLPAVAAVTYVTRFVF